MTLGLFLIIVFAVGAALAAYAVFAPRRRLRGPAAAPQASADWASEADDEFADLSDAARCELVFAVAALGDERSRFLLERALDDPAEAVALAAAHALATSGRGDAVRAYARAHPGERAQLLVDTIGWMAEERER
jgi:hypothetical protein